MSDGALRKIGGAALWIAEQAARGEDFVARLANKGELVWPLRRIEPGGIYGFYEMLGDPGLIISEEVAEHFQEHPGQRLAGSLALQVFDPVMWMAGPGALSKVGKGAKFAQKYKTAAQAVKAAGQVAEGISWSRPYAKMRALSQARAVGKWAGRGAVPFAGTWAEQARAGHRMLLGFGGRPVPGIQKAAAPLFELGGKIRRPIMKALYKKGAALHTGIKHIDDVLDAHWYRGFALGQAESTRNAKQMISLWEGLDDLEMDNFQRAIAGAESPFSPKVREAVDFFRGLTDDMAQKEIRAGLLSPEQYRKWKGQYEIGIPTKEGRKFLKARYGDVYRGGGVGPYEFAESLGAHQRRRIRPPGQSIIDYNREMAPLWERYGIKSKRKIVLEENPGLRIYARTVAHHKAMADHELLETMMRKFRLGKDVDISDRAAIRALMLAHPQASLYIPKHRFFRTFPTKPAEKMAQELKAILNAGDDVIIGPGDIDNVLAGLPSYGAITHKIAATPIPADVAMVVNRINLAHRNPGSVLEFFNTVGSTWTGYWKIGALFYPGYTVRNFTTNLWKNFLANVADPAYYVKAIRARTGRSVAINTVEGVKDGRWLTKAAEDWGVFGGHGFFGAHYAQTPAEMLGKTRPWQIFKKWRNFNTAVEDNARLAHFIGRLEQGDAVAEAARSVNKYLFSYARVTPVGQKVFRNLLPFGRWWVRNIPSELEAVLRQPAKYAGLAKVIRSVEAMLIKSPPNEAFLADYLQDEMGIPIGENPDGTYNYMLLGRWHPVGDLLRLIPWGETGALRKIYKAPEKIMRELLNMSGGPWKAIMEAYIGKSTFFGDLQQYPGQPGYIAGLVRAPRRLAHAIEGAVAPPLRVGTRFRGLLEKGVPPIEAAIKAPLGFRFYKYDPKKSKQYYISNLQRQLGKMQGDWRRAKAVKDTPRMEKIQRMILDLRSQIDQLKKT